MFTPFYIMKEGVPGGGSFHTRESRKSEQELAAYRAQVIEANRTERLSLEEARPLFLVYQESIEGRYRKEGVLGTIKLDVEMARLYYEAGFCEQALDMVIGREGILSHFYKLPDAGATELYDQIDEMAYGWEEEMGALV